MGNRLKAAGVAQDMRSEQDQQLSAFFALVTFAEQCADPGNIFEYGNAALGGALVALDQSAEHHRVAVGGGQIGLHRALLDGGAILDAGTG